MLIAPTNFVLSKALCPEGYLVSAPSFLVDRFVPACEIIRLPPREFGGGGGHFVLGPGEIRPEQPGDGSHYRSLIERLRPVAAKPARGPGILIDFRRRHTPKNWTHFLNDYLPALLYLCARTGLRPQELTIVMPRRTPTFILKAADLFGLTTLTSDAVLQGTVLDFGFDTWNTIRADRADWVRGPYVDAVLAPLRGPPATPRRLFISRRDTRVLENEAEIETFLAGRGYQKIYAEDFGPADQFRMFEAAEAIVAIHGAALGPLLYRSQTSALRQVVELFPVGHLTNVFRAVASQVGCRWAGVRGQLRPEHVKPVYDFSQPFKRFSLQAFRVDPSSLDLALKLCEDGSERLFS
jgi:capsular polysaccharide biosynthesis protein